MSNDDGTMDSQALQEKYDEILVQVVHFRKKYPAHFASHLSSALKKDVDMMMEAEVIPTQKSNNSYSPQHLDIAKLEKLNLTTKLEPFPNKSEDLHRQISDIHTALNQIRAARHKNVQE